MLSGNHRLGCIKSSRHGPDCLNLNIEGCMAFGEDRVMKALQNFPARNLVLRFAKVGLFWERSAFISSSCGTHSCFLPSCQHILLGYLRFPWLQSIKIMARSDLALVWVIPKRDGCRASQDLRNHELHGTFSDRLLTCRVFVSFFFSF